MALVGCSGDEIGRIHFTSNGTAETTIHIDGNRDTQLWVDQSPASWPRYEVKFLQNDTSILETTCAFSDTTPNNHKNKGGGSSFARCARLGKLHGGKTRVKATLSSVSGSKSARYDLVITQQ